MHHNAYSLHGTADHAPYVINPGAGSCDKAPGIHRPHRHDTLELVYIRSGFIDCHQGADVYKLHAGTAIVHPPSISHVNFGHTPFSTYFVHLDAPRAHEWPRIYHDDEAQTLARVCCMIANEWKGEAANRDRMLTLLHEQVRLLLDRAAADPERSTSEKVVAAAKRVIDERYGTRLTVDDVAREIGVSPRTLHGHFARVQGETPIAHLQGVRLRRAIGLLHHSDMTLETVADRCGFSSASHLSRHVKTATGASPGQLRTRHPLQSNR